MPRQRAVFDRRAMGKALGEIAADTAPDEAALRAGLLRVFKAALKRGNDEIRARF
ncbi:MAG: hypothetical protein HOI33_07030, partial [Rhodospirillaceae bacterium]|nr:hypothetical protein [Rhodospirillaceae bacterium]